MLFNLFVILGYEPQNLILLFLDQFSKFREKRKKKEKKNSHNEDKMTDTHRSKPGIKIWANRS